MDALLAAAEPGSIVATAATAAFLRRRFVVEASGRTISGGALYRLVSHEAFDIGEGERGTPFVGRSQDLAFLQSRLRLALAGRGQLAAIVGDPGIGKSRLVREFTQSYGPGTAKLFETGSAYASITPYLPVVQLLRRYFALDPDIDPGGIAERVDAKLRALDPALEQIAPALRALLGDPNAEWAALDPIERRHRTLDAVKRLLVTESQVQPLLIVFEDVHWIDSASEAVLDVLVEVLPATRLLLLLTHRSKEYQHRRGDLSYYSQLNLGPLASDSANQLLQSLLGSDASLTSVKQYLVNRTAGNPLFLEESVQSLVETGALEGARGAYRVNRFEPSGDVPATIQDILATRIERLAVEDRAVLQSAATIGADVPLALLSAIVDLSPETLSASMQRLQAAELLYQNSATIAPAYVFKHALTRDMAYQSLPSSRRRELHRRIVAITEEAGEQGAPEHVGRLARHAFEGELWAKAVKYLREAGDRAMGSAAVRQATEHYRSALDASSHLRASPQDVQDLSGQGILGEVVDVRLRMRDAMWTQLRFPELLENLREADDIAQRLGDRRRLGWVACYLCCYFWSVAELEEARAAGDRALQIALEIDDRALLAETNFYRGLTQKAAGAFGKSVTLLLSALHDLEEVISRPKFEIPSRRFALNGPVIARSFLMRALSQLGRFSDAIAHGRDAIRLAETIGNPFAKVAAGAGLGLVYVRMGEPLNAVPFLEPCVQECRAYGLNHWFPTVGGPLGFAYAQIGRVAEGLVLLRESVDHGNRFGLHSSSAAWRSISARAISSPDVVRMPCRRRIT